MSIFDNDDESLSPRWELEGEEWKQNLQEFLDACRLSAEEHEEGGEEEVREQTEEEIHREMERLTLIWRITDTLLADEAPEKLAEQTGFLMGLRPAFAIAVLEALPRERLQLLSLDAWNWWLNVVPEGLRPAVEALWARWEFGPRHADAIATADCELLNAREYVDNRLFERIEAERKAEARARLERRRRRNR
jgi:hypothetical protein